MPHSRALPEGPFLVVGLARSGVAAALALRERGAGVIGFDGGDPAVDELRIAGVDVHLGGDGVQLVPRARTLVKSPGVRGDAAIVRAARARGMVVMGELELAWRMLANEFVAVTGTNGKTTTVELIGEIHRAGGLDVAVAGNVGRALSSLVGSVSRHATVVCEASSFQLEDTIGFAPQAAVLLNLTDDHLDRHGTSEAYLAAKLEIFRRQGNDDIAVVPDNSTIEDFGGCARRVTFGSTPAAELADRAGQLWWDEQPLMAVSEIRLRGPHNRLNAMAAAAVTLARGVPADAVRYALNTFAGVAHRLEEIAQHDGVTYVNDSKATNIASTLVALRSFEPGTIHLILGGQGKGQDFTLLRDMIAKYCAATYLIGEDTPLIEAALEGLRNVHCCGHLERSVAASRAAAHPGQVVLLSPACASFDQFGDYEERGECFRELVG